MPVPTSAVALAVDVLHPSDLRQGEQSIQPDDPAYAWHLLADGDSWFSLGAIPSSNLLFELRTDKWAQVLNLAYPGDTVRNISDWGKNPDFNKFVKKRNFSYRWDALLLSAGGNDVIDAATSIIRKKAQPKSSPNDVEAFIEKDALDKVLVSIQSGVARLHRVWNSAESQSAGNPIFLHTYDYSTPRNAPARFLGGPGLAGPWLFPAFAGSGIDIATQQRIANRLIDRLAEALLELDAKSQTSQALANVVVVDTRNTLVMANPAEVGRSNDWLNEIHPTLDGYRKIAARLSARINAVLGSAAA